MWIHTSGLHGDPQGRRSVFMESPCLDKITRVNMLHSNGGTGWQRVIIGEPYGIPMILPMITGNTLYSTPVGMKVGSH